MSFPYYRQLDQMDCGSTCLRMIAKYYGKHYSAQTLRQKAQISKEGVSMLGIAEAAEGIGFRSIGIKVSLEKLLTEAPLPCVLHWGQNHFVVLYAVSSQRSAIGKRFMATIWGGKRTSIDFEAMEGNRKSEMLKHPASLQRDFLSLHPDEGTGETIHKTFHIADPSKGLISYDTDEFKRYWLSGNVAGRKEGIALLLEPTAGFYAEEGEKGSELHLWRLLGYLWQYKKLVLQLVLTMLVGSGVSLLMPFLTQSVVDVGIATQNLSFIYLVLISQLVLLCSTAGVDFLRSWILLHISTRLNLTILSEFLSKLMRLPVSFFDVKQFGDVMQRIGDHHRIESFLTGQTLGVLFSLFNLLIFGFVLAYYHLNIFVVAMSASALYAVWIVLFLKQRRKLDAKRFLISSRNQSQIVQLIQGMQDIKLACAETPKRWEWERTQATLFKWNVKSLSLSQFQQAGALLINQTKNIFITFLAAKAVVNGQLTLGEMMSVQYILGQFNAPIEMMIGFLRSWQDAQISLERLNEVHGLADEEPTHGQRRETWDHKRDICLSDVTYTYPGAGNEPVLKNIDLTIPHGKTTAIVGTSGSGKTTLLRLLLRFYEPERGVISLKSKRENSLIAKDGFEDTLLRPFESGELGFNFISHRAWRQQCGVVMQEGFIFSDTIARNIVVADEIIDQEKMYQATRMANIHEFIESLPLGYHTKIGAEGNGISQGQKQRILIARAVYKNPELLLFDEATNALDASNEATIIQNLNEFFQGRTVVVVAHRLSTVKHADQIVVMEKGQIVEVGTHTELVLKKGKYFELVSNQLDLAV